MRYYDISAIRDLGCDYNFIVSGRGPGKSTAVVNHLIDCFCGEPVVRGGREARQKFVRIMRFDWAASSSLMGRWFNAVNVAHLEEMGFDRPYVRYQGGEWRLFAADDPDAYQVMGYMMPLNAQDEYKSGALDEVTNVVMEEFALLRERDYIPGEIELFFSALSTVVRARHDVRCWFVGNTISAYNPYFEFFGIDPARLDLKPGDIRSFRCSGFEGKGATLAIQHAEMSYESVDEIAPLMRVGGNAQATEGGYLVEPSVANYDKLTAGLADSDFGAAVPGVAGAYLGDGRFCTLEVSMRPRFDGMRLFRMRALPADEAVVFSKKWLNLSGAMNPEYRLGTLKRVIPCTSPYLLYADTEAFREFQRGDASTVHAFETEEMRHAWRVFVDQIGYERGAL